MTQGGKGGKWKRIAQGEGGQVKQGRLTVFALDKLEELRREVVAELAERVVQLVRVDRAGSVAIEVPVDVLPVLDVLPQSCELRKRGKLISTVSCDNDGNIETYLVEADRAAPIRVLCRRKC